MLLPLTVTNCPHYQIYVPLVVCGIYHQVCAPVLQAQHESCCWHHQHQKGDDEASVGLYLDLHDQCARSLQLEELPPPRAALGGLLLRRVR